MEIILNMFGSIINNYGLDIKSIHHSDFYTHKFFPVTHTFPSLAPYPHGDTEPLVFFVPYDNIHDIPESFQPHIRSGKVLHWIGRMICDPYHNFCSYTRN